jgi:sucrose phosphorylase
MDLLACSGIGRDVNRHYYTPAEINADLTRPVVQALGRLIRFRNTHPAFLGTLTFSGGASRIVMTWTRGGDEAVLDADLAAGTAEVTWTEDGIRRHAPLASLP